METSPVVVAIPETEVSAKPKRRYFTAKQKLEVLEEAGACAQPGQLGALLRRRGIYSSTLSDWRRARELGHLDALSPKKRGPKAKAPHPLERENSELKRALAKSEARAKRAEALVEVQKKVSQLLGIALPESDEVP